MEDLNQDLVAKKAKKVRYVYRINGYQQNRLFRVAQKRIYKEINGKCTDEKLILDKKVNVFAVISGAKAGSTRRMLDGCKN